jgi:hypothetical protein
VFWVRGRFFSDEPLQLGLEGSEGRVFPCGQRTDTGRARLVRRRKRGFALCCGCEHRLSCLALTTTPTLLWQWQGAGALDRDLRLTGRGELMSFFLGPEGLALAAALADRRYSLELLLYDLADLYGGDRFSGTNPRRSGRLARVCELAYRGLSIDGFLEDGVPLQYGCGASEVLRCLVEEGGRARDLLDEHMLAGVGDIDRVLTEWRSLLRQVLGAPAELRYASRGEALLSARWRSFRQLCQERRELQRVQDLPELPGLEPGQKGPINHRFFQKPHSGTPRR